MTADTSVRVYSHSRDILKFKKDIAIVWDERRPITGYYRKLLAEGISKVSECRIN